MAEGADLLGVAGGDGTQALVAAVAAEHDVPLLVISAGTRNHFALDLGLDREDPSRCLDALHDGVELRVDLGFIAGRPFVNNASFGAYAAIVQSPAYRDDKARTTLDQLPGLLAGHEGPRLVARAENVTVQGPQAVLVSNNAYGMGDIAGLGRRARLDRGTLGVFAVTVSSAAQAAGLLRGQPLAGADQPDHPRGGDRRRHRPDPGRGRRRGPGAGHPGALCHRSRPPCGSGSPATAPGSPIPSPSWTGTGCGTWPSPDQAPTVDDTAGPAGPAPPATIYGGVLGELDQIDQAVYRAIAATPSP